MTESTKLGETKSDPEPETKTKPIKSELGSPLQWFREGIAGLISLVVLAIAALMLYGTYNYVRDTPANADATVAATRKESYERQKDIMLYALALLGTVTGYYLGRVPAELHAQQAQKSANTAQDQLQKTQTKLTDTAGSAAAAATQVTIAEKEKDTAKAKAAKAVDALVVAKDAIAKTLSSPVSKTLGESAGGPVKDAENLRLAQQEIEATLREIRDARI
jgi:hypothetical protein